MRGRSPHPVPVLLMARELGIGGSERQLAAIAATLDRTRFAPAAGCMQGGGMRAAELRDAGVPVVEFPVRSLYGPSAIASARLMGQYLESSGTQLVHTFDVPMNLFGAPVARLYRTPVVLTSQRAYRSLTPGLHRHLLRITDQIADAVVVNCDAMRRHLIEEEALAPSRIHLCYNGVDPVEFHPLGRVTSPEVTVGVVCALRPEKGLSTLLTGFAQAQCGGSRLLIVGSGPQLTELRSLSASLGIEAVCRFEPATDRVADWLRHIDIFVLPSLSEALSNSLMEAMACGCAAVASRVGGNPELVEDGVTGLTFGAGDAAGLASALRMLIEREEWRRGMAAAGALRIREEFSCQAAARRMGGAFTARMDAGGMRRRASAGSGCSSTSSTISWMRAAIARSSSVPKTFICSARCSGVRGGAFSASSRRTLSWMRFSR
ncbi:MAG: glycosyltransferase family 4 protein, partial [Bryobacteraceae bacterium]